MDKKCRTVITVIMSLIFFLLIGILRVYTDALEPLDAVCIVKWELPKVMWDIFHALAAFSLLLGPILYWWGFKKDGATLTALMYGAGAVGLLAKTVFKLPRPPTATECTYGYPSGSSQIAVMGWGFLTRYAYRYTEICAVVVSVLVGLSRLGLGEHYFTDVIGGWLLGIACLYTAFYLLTVKMPEKLWKRWILILASSTVLFIIGWNAELVPERVGMFCGFLLGYSVMRNTWAPITTIRGVAALILGFFIANIMRNVILHLSDGIAIAAVSTLIAGLWIALCPRFFVRVKLLCYVEE
jgi:membrane-associated phospholipid phosphatase